MSYSFEQQLHDRATRGEKLSLEEKMQLDLWRAELNRQRMQALFNQDESPSFEEWEEKARQLQKKIDSLFAQIAVDSALLQQLVEQNKQLRLENTALRNQIIEQSRLELA